MLKMEGEHDLTDINSFNVFQWFRQWNDVDQWLEVIDPMEGQPKDNTPELWWSTNGRNVPVQVRMSINDELDLVATIVEDNTEKGKLDRQRKTNTWLNYLRNLPDDEYEKMAGFLREEKEEILKRVATNNDGLHTVNELMLFP